MEVIMPYIIITSIISIIVALLALQNGAATPLNFIIWQFEIPLICVILTSFLAGALVSSVVLMYSNFRHFITDFKNNREISRLNKKVDDLQKNIALLQFDIAVIDAVNALIVVVYGNGQRDFCFILPDDIFIQFCFYFLRFEQRRFLKRGFLLPFALRIGAVFIVQNRLAQFNTLIANIYTATGNHFSDCLLRFSAKGARDGAVLIFIIISGHSITPLFVIVS